MAEYTSGPGSTWREALRRAGRVLVPRTARRRRWSMLVPVIAALAGLLFTTSARTAAGTNLRDDRRPELTRLIEERQAQVAGETSRAAGLRTEIDGLTRRPRPARTAGSPTQQARGRRAARRPPGSPRCTVPGSAVVLDDAPRRPDGSLPTGARPDDVVVHQQDVQSVVNALWAGGAEAMMIMGVRVISTSAVRCVGNTLLLHGQVFSPPFAIAAIGEPSPAARRARRRPGCAGLPGRGRRVRARLPGRRSGPTSWPRRTRAPSRSTTRPWRRHDDLRLRLARIVAAGPTTPDDTAPGPAPVDERPRSRRRPPTPTPPQSRPSRSRRASPGSTSRRRTAPSRIRSSTIRLSHRYHCRRRGPASTSLPPTSPPSCPAIRTAPSRPPPARPRLGHPRRTRRPRRRTSAGLIWPGLIWAGLIRTGWTRTATCPIRGPARRVGDRSAGIGRHSSGNTGSAAPSEPPAKS